MALRSGWCLFLGLGVWNLTSPLPATEDKSQTLLNRGLFMPITLTTEIRSLIDGANFGHLATLMADGSPQSVPVWVGREEDRILICTGDASLKAKNTQRD